MARIWRYVLAHDSGHAPCVDKGMLTLCCCKPRIRANAAIGDWVIGFAPKRFGIGLVAWAGRVSSRMAIGAYGESFPHRSDAIYRSDGIGADGCETLRHIGGEYHAAPRMWRTDASGAHCLFFSLFWYFGHEPKMLPEHLQGLAYYFIGQSARGSTPEKVADLRTWLGVWPAGVHGRPRDAAVAVAGEIQPHTARVDVPIRGIRSASGCR